MYVDPVARLVQIVNINCNVEANSFIEVLLINSAEILSLRIDPSSLYFMILLLGCIQK